MNCITFWIKFNNCSFNEYMVLLLKKSLWGGLSNAIPYLYDKLLSFFYKGSMKFCGKHVYIRPSSSDFKGLWNLSVGDYTSIPKGSVFYCTEAPLTIGKKVIFGPRPTIITGDHRIK